jgi:hypothetical protein
MFGSVCVAGERPLPEGVELITQRSHRCRVQSIDPSCAGYPLTDQAGILEHLQVLRDRRPTDWQSRRKLPDGLWFFGQAGNDGAPRTIRQCAPWLARSVSIR